MEKRGYGQKILNTTIDNNSSRGQVVLLVSFFKTQKLISKWVKWRKADEWMVGGLEGQQKTENRSQKTEDRSQKSEDRRQKTEGSVTSHINLTILSRNILTIAQ